MRLSEKTIELNFSAQYRPVGSTLDFLDYFHPPIWFGLTQKQEKLAGFDACTRFGGRLLIFQFKASCKTNAQGARTFTAEHSQMEVLRVRVTTKRSVRYVFPLVGTTHELAANPNVVAQSWGLDVADIPPLNPPRRRDGELRLTGCHYVDVWPGTAVIHSDPVKVPLSPAGDVFDPNTWREDLARGEFDNTGEMMNLIRELSVRPGLLRGSVGVLLRPL